MYNTLDSVNALMDSGFTHQQAQAMVTVMTSYCQIWCMTT